MPGCADEALAASARSVSLSLLSTTTGGRGGTDFSVEVVDGVTGGLVLVSGPGGAGFTRVAAGGCPVDA